MSNVTLTVTKFCEKYEKKLRQGRSIRVDTWFAESGKVLDVLRSATKESTDASSLKTATVAWVRLSKLLKLLIYEDRNVHFPGFVEQACTSWWDSVTKSQIEFGFATADAYRGMAAYVVAQLAFRRRDRGASLRWASLGYLADKLSGSQAGGGNEVTLRFGLAVPQETLNLLDNLATEGCKRNIVEGLPEWLLAEAFDDPRGVSLVSPSELYSHHPCTPFVQAAAEPVLADEGTPDEKGKRLEKFAAFLVSTVPGMRPQRRFVTAGSTSEHDVVATLFGETPYPLPARATEWLIECKNRKDSVTVQEVGHFLAKMQHAGANFGIIIAKTGVTGAEEQKYAELFRREFALREGIVCLVVDARDLRELGEGGTFRSLIDKKYEEWRFGK